MIGRLLSIFQKYKKNRFTSRMGLLAPSALFCLPRICPTPEKIFIHNNVSLGPESKFIMQVGTPSGKFVAKHHASIGAGLTVISNNHATTGVDIKQWFSDAAENNEGDTNKDVIVEEEVWCGANVTLLLGVTIGRGAIIGAGSVVRTSIPPYSIVTGNPAKVVGFKFRVDEIIEHEKELYIESERIPKADLEKNYKKYFLDRTSEIRSYIRLYC